MSRVAVTGGAGMIGSALTRRLVAEGHSVIVIDNLSRGRRENLMDDHGKLLIAPESLITLDLARQDVTEVITGCETLFHLADIVGGIGYVFNHELDIYRENTLINTNTFTACRRAGVRRVIYAATACSFPAHLQTGTDAQLREDQLYPAFPESAYGWSKLMGQYELSLGIKHGIFGGTSAILHNVYGPRTDYASPRSQVIPALIFKAMQAQEANRKTIEVWGSGRQGRAFLYVDDAVDGLVGCLSANELPTEVQFGPGSCVSIGDLARQIVALVNPRLTVEFDLTKPEGDRGRYADYSRASALLGWAPKTDLVDGLRKTVSWIASDLETKISRTTAMK